MLVGAVMPLTLVTLPAYAQKLVIRLRPYGRLPGSYFTRNKMAADGTAQN
jgi:hypothetical protein